MEVRARHDGASVDRHETEVPLRQADEARSFLRRHCSRRSALGELRQLATDGRLGTSGLSDEEVLASVGRRLASGQLILVSVPVPASVPASGGGVEAGAGAAPPMPPRRPPTMAPSASLLPPHPAPAPARVAAAPEDFAGVEQDSQAAALEQAAASGVPFCEVCEKARKAKAARTNADADAVAAA
jgi:hypothetical protein